MLFNTVISSIEGGGGSGGAGSSQPELEAERRGLVEIIARQPLVAHKAQAGVESYGCLVGGDRLEHNLLGPRLDHGLHRTLHQPRA